MHNFFNCFGLRKLPPLPPGEYFLKLYNQSSPLKSGPIFNIILQIEIHKFRIVQYLDYNYIFCLSSVGTLPGEGSFAMHAILANHYLFGASYPRGGASEIAFHIIPVIEKPGGKVLVRATVSKILVDGISGKVKGKVQ